MKYLCTKCNYIYDEMLWEVDDGVEFWTKFENVGDHFSCPNCYESSEYFQEVQMHVHSLDEDFLLWIEAEHIPIIDVLEDWMIKITVNHPDEDSHFVWNIWIYDEYWDMVYEQFFTPDMPVYLEYDVSDLEEYEVRVQCNIHGTFWKKVMN